MERAVEGGCFRGVADAALEAATGLLAPHRFRLAPLLGSRVFSVPEVVGWPDEAAVVVRPVLVLRRQAAARGDKGGGGGQPPPSAEGVSPWTGLWTARAVRGGPALLGWQ